jgi:hypothetical protein
MYGSRYGISANGLSQIAITIKVDFLKAKKMISGAFRHTDFPGGKPSKMTADLAAVGYGM